MRQRASLAALLWLAVAILGGCVGGTADCEALPTRIELTLATDGLEPSNPAVCRDREVTLIVTPEVNGILHIHGYDEHLPATEVAAGEVSELSFTAVRSGQFPIELHTDEDTQGTSVGILTVHEP
jgi:hypothetical protein